MPRLIDLAGRSFGRLIVLRRAVGAPPRWHCRCECGGRRAVLGAHLRSGAIQSCGCLRREQAAARGRERAEALGGSARTHGLSDHPLYRVWAEIIRRCENPRERSYRWYGARGVRMCLEWRQNPDRFIRWAIQAGWRSGLCVGRKGDVGDYSPGNCLLQTRSESSRAAIDRKGTGAAARAAYRAGRSPHPSSLRVGGRPPRR